MLIVALLAILAGAPANADPVPPPSGAHVRLERGACTGDCPVYSLDLNEDGLVVYQGDDHVLVKGRHLYRIDPGAVPGLLKRFRASGFLTWRASYVTVGAELPRNVITATYPDGSWSVTEQGGVDAGAPAEAGALEEAVDQTAGAENWVRGGPETLRHLKDERFDFASDEGAAMLAQAASDGRDELVAELLAAGAPLEVRSGFLRPQNEGASALEQAIAADRPAIVRRLIAAGGLAETGLRDRALRSAAAACNLDIITEVLRFGPNVNAADARGVTPLMLAAGCEHAALGNAAGVGGPEIITSLLVAGAQPALQDIAGDGALHRAGNPDDVLALLRGHAPLETRDLKGRTPLLTAASEDVALSLLEAGANSRVLDNHNTGLIDRARREGWSRVLRRLLR